MFFFLMNFFFKLTRILEKGNGNWCAVSINFSSRHRTQESIHWHNCSLLFFFIHEFGKFSIKNVTGNSIDLFDQL